MADQAFYGVFWATFYRPRVVVVMAIVQSIAFMTLFGLFYRQGTLVRKDALPSGSALSPACR